MGGIGLVSFMASVLYPRARGAAPCSLGPDDSVGKHPI